MKNTKWLMLPILFVIGHSALLLVMALATQISKHSSNPDSSIGFLMMCITLWVVDLPISLLFSFLFETNVPQNALGNPLLTIVVLYGIAGNLVWFALGTVLHFCIAPLLRRRRP